MLRRYVHGDRVDEPLVQYNGSAIGTSAWRYLHADHQGSIIAQSDVNGTVISGSVMAYDTYGITSNSTASRFGYTGQIQFPELGLYYYKARVYSPKLGRFLQTDPIGYKDNMNLYSYTGNDPVNMVDPSGTSTSSPCGDHSDCSRFAWDGSDGILRGVYGAPKPNDVPQITGAPASNTTNSSSTLSQIGDGLKDALWDRPMPGEGVAVAGRWY